MAPFLLFRDKSQVNVVERRLRSSSLLKKWRLNGFWFLQTTVGSFCRMPSQKIRRSMQRITTGPEGSLCYQKEALWCWNRITCVSLRHYAPSHQLTKEVPLNKEAARTKISQSPLQTMPINIKQHEVKINEIVIPYFANLLCL